MKKSNFWLGAAVAVLLLALSFYNLALRAEFRRGTFRHPERTAKALAYRDFSRLDLPAAGRLRVRVVAGPFAVRVSEAAAPFVRVSQQGAQLTVRLRFPEPDAPRLEGQADLLTISLPRLTELRAGAAYEENGRLRVERREAPGRVRVEGFRQDSLRLSLDAGARLELAGNALGYLRAEAAPAPGSTPSLSVGADNRIAAADLRLGARAELALLGRVGRLRGQYGDSVRVTISGAGLGTLGEQVSPERRAPR